MQKKGPLKKRQSDIDGGRGRMYWREIYSKYLVVKCLFVSIFTVIDEF